ncbi:delta endotoxin C-terminal domain-containing protein, partial [Bacillus anthracis]|uniref:delta endotoxin C-terminal domain-containing protein n=3 Tax=Bacillaceae TaxID=186817 RepID=UPI003A8A2CF0
MPKAVDPNNPNAPRSQWKDSHSLSYFKYEPIRSNSPYGYPNKGQIGAVALEWTHMLVDPYNIVAPDKITQIPAVKAYSISGAASAIKGPGSTGGDLVKISNGTTTGNMKMFLVTPPGPYLYRLRIRYASNMQTHLTGHLQGGGTYTPFQLTVPATTTDITNLTYNKFKYIDVGNLSGGYPNVESSVSLDISATGNASGSF